MNKLIIVAAGVLAAAPSVASAAPAWCGNAKFDRYDLHDLSSKDAEQVVTTLVKASCAPNAEAQTQLADIDQARAAWGKRLAMDDADWADAVAYAGADRNSIKWDLSTKDLAQFTPLDQYAAINRGFNGPNGGGPMADDMYIADALETKLAEAGRLALIEQCIESHSTSDGGDAATYAICDGDIKRFDLAKLGTQLRADTAHSGEARMYVRLRAYELAAKLKAHSDDVARIIKLDPAYKKMFELAEQGRTEWTTGVGANTSLLQLAMAMDSAAFSHSRGLFEGCEDKTSEALKTAVSKIPAKMFAKMLDVRDDPTAGFAHAAEQVIALDPNVHLAAAAYIECQPTSGISEFLGAAVQHYPGHRGPRSAALAKMTGGNLALDDMSQHLYFPHFDSRPYRTSHGSSMSFGGVIKSVKPGDDFITVEFEKETVKQEDCVKEHHSNRIERVEDNGTVLYQLICDKTAIVTHDRTVPPMKIEPAYATLLKPGVRISVIHNNSSGGGSTNGRHGHPKKASENLGGVIATWANKSATLPSSVLGAPIK